MARYKIREYDAKRLMAENIPNLDCRNVLVTPETNLDVLPKEHPWLLTSKLVVKPDQLFGKRKKLGLVLINADFAQVKEFILTHRNKPLTIGKATDTLTHFLIEPYIPHEQEYYLSITSRRDGNTIHFSSEGGQDIEERWHSIKKIVVPTLGTVEGSMMNEEFLNGVPENHQPTIQQFIKNLYHAYLNLDFTYLELNPFTITAPGDICILDTVAHLDGSAAWKNSSRWNIPSFPPEFGKKSYPEETFIENLDRESGASLKLTILNPQGRIWNILSGGGASIIYLDTIVNRGYGQELANYGEYSGNPSMEESYHYAKTVIDLMTREHHPQGKILLIAGAIANFTDIEKTFQGIIRALREYQHQLREGNIKIFVRRGGPNYENGLALIEKAGKEIGVPMEIHGPDKPMVHIISPALEMLP
ncbi:ATPase [Candidatus Woesearchaeota archaeon]|nr:ATPase [Candidatus Woesearchaeota archaeon]